MLIIDNVNTQIDFIDKQVRSLHVNFTRIFEGLRGINPNFFHDFPNDVHGPVPLLLHLSQFIPGRATTQK